MRPSIKESTINFLAQRTYSTAVLLENVQGLSGCTKQGFYKTLRKLKSDEVIIIRNKIVSLSFLWVQGQFDFYTSILEKYLDIKGKTEDFLLLGEKDSIVYKFQNPTTTDQFWIHSLNIINKKIKPEKPLCIYNPHEWFLLLRNKSEKAMFKNVKNAGRKLFVLVDHTDPLDTVVRKDFDFMTDYYYCSPKKVFNKPNYYLNILDDYIIEVFLDQKTSEIINSWYTRHKRYTKDAQSELKNIIESRGRNKLIISRDKERADKLRKVFSKFFVLD